MTTNLVARRSAVLRHSGRDPAFGSGPLATVVQDLLTLCIYFALAVAIV
jgi:magnesium transporter